MRIFFVTLLILFPVVTAWAQDNKNLEPVIVEGTRAEPPLDFPSAFSTTLNTDEFEGEYNTSADILSLSPGVVVRDYGGFGQLKTVSIRGSSGNQVVVLLDGLRLNSPLTGVVDFSTIPVQYVDKIEVVRGGGSALVGNDALGGIINIRTRPAGDPFTFASLTYGSFNTLSLNLSASRKTGDLGYFISYNHSMTDGDFEFESVNDEKIKRINNGFKSDSLLLKLEYDLGDLDITFLNEFYHDDKGVPGLGEFQEDSSNQKDLRNLTSLKIQKTGFFIPEMDLETDVYHKYDKLEYTDQEPQIGIPLDTNSRLSTIGMNNKLTWYQSPNQITTFALDFQYDDLRDEDYDNPSRSNIGLFAGDELLILDNKVNINSALRFDYYHTVNSEDKNDWALSPKLGVIYSPFKNINFKGNISYSHRIPNFSELYLPEQRFIGGNPDLKKEKSFDFDIGFSYSASKLFMELDYFRSKVRDSILFVFVSSQRIEPRNVGNVTEQGIEANIVYKPDKFLEFFGSYTFLDGEINDTGAQLPGRPRNKLDLRVVLKYSLINLFGETHFVDQIPLTPFKNSRTTDARTVYDLGAKLAWDKYFLTIEAKNIFNNLDVRDSFDFPLPGRSVYFTAGIKY